MNRIVGYAQASSSTRTTVRRASDYLLLRLSKVRASIAPLIALRHYASLARRPTNRRKRFHVHHERASEIACLPHMHVYTETRHHSYLLYTSKLHLIPGIHDLDQQRSAQRESKSHLAAGRDARCQRARGCCRRPLPWHERGSRAPSPRSFLLFVIAYIVVYLVSFPFGYCINCIINRSEKARSR